MEWLKCIRFQSYNLNISKGKSVGYKCLYRWRMRSSDWSSLSLSNWVDGVGIDLISWIKSGWNQNLIHTRIFPLTLIRKIEKSRLEKNFTRYELGQFFEIKVIEWLQVIIDGRVKSGWNQDEQLLNNSCNYYNWYLSSIISMKLYLTQIWVKALVTPMFNC